MISVPPFVVEPELRDSSSEVVSLASSSIPSSVASSSYLLDTPPDTGSESHEEEGTSDQHPMDVDCVPLQADDSTDDPTTPRDQDQGSRLCRPRTRCRRKLQPSD